MTLRDLTGRQLYNLQRRCEKERKAWLKKTPLYLVGLDSAWMAAYNKGLKAGLELQPIPEAQK